MHMHSDSHTSPTARTSRRALNCRTFTFSTKKGKVPKVDSWMEQGSKYSLHEYLHVYNYVICKSRIQTILGLSRANLGFNLCRGNPRMVLVSLRVINRQHYTYSSGKDKVNLTILYVQQSCNTVIGSRTCRTKRKKNNLFLISACTMYNSHMHFSKCTFSHICSADVNCAFFSRVKCPSSCRC